MMFRYASARESNTPQGVLEQAAQKSRWGSPRARALDKLLIGRGNDKLRDNNMLWELSNTHY